MRLRHFSRSWGDGTMIFDRSIVCITALIKNSVTLRCYSVTYNVCFEHAQSLFTASIGALKDSSRKWTEEEPNAIKLRADMLSAFSYALRNVPNAKRALKAIREGAGNPDMLKDLSALVALGKNYPNELKAINFDLSSLDTTAAKTTELNNLYNEAFIEKKTVEFRELRDRAFTYMRKIMGEILDAAEYVLRDNPQRLDLYHSSYRSRASGSNGSGEEGAESTASATPTA
jgi:hypothetical protein